MRVLKSSGRRLKADDLGPNWRASVRIQNVREEQIGTDMKAVMYFEGHTKGLVLNATNIDALVALFGTDESEFWIGRSVELFTAQTTFQGKPTLGIRVRVPSSRDQARPPLAQTPRPREPGDDDEPLTHKDIPW